MFAWIQVSHSQLVQTRCLTFSVIILSTTTDIGLAHQISSFLYVYEPYLICFQISLNYLYTEILAMAKFNY